MRLALRLAALSASLLAVSSVASAYYHWIYFAGRSAPFQPIAAKFALNALPNKTVQYFISEQPPTALMPGDTVTGIISQIRLAADVWDGVTASDLRLKFGGYGAATSQTAPAVDVIFNDDMPPGVLALTYVARPDDVNAAVGATGAIPILRSRVQLRRDLTVKQQASYSEKFFTTLVHEFGHSLGLQHTLTSSAMTTFVTRATTKGKPLGADDIAGIAALYPAADFALTTGSINGRVALNGEGVNLASVVAISASTGAAISGMTNPDGTYRIDGIPPGDYYVYTHPLPPAQSSETTPADIVAPVDFQNNPFPANTRFGTQFFPGTRDYTQAFTVNVTANNNAGGINFNVQGSNGPALANMQTYGFYGPTNNQVAVPAPWLAAGRRSYLAFYADGALVNGNQLAPGLNVRILGSAAQIEPGSLQFYAPNFVLVIVNAPPTAAATPVALAVTTNTDLYVLPTAFFITPSAVPAVTSVSGTTDGLGDSLVSVSGTGLTPDTRVFFDGALGQTREQRSDGSLLVSAPPGSGVYRASLVAVNPDGQTSAQALGTALPSSFTYAAPDTPVFSIRNNFLTPGSDAMIEIQGFGGAKFTEGLVSLGLGTTDIVVKRIWFLGRDLMRANVSVSPSATPGSTTVTLASGLQMTSLRTILQIVNPNPRLQTLRAPVVSQETGMAGVPVGGTAVISSQGLPNNLAGWTLTIGDVRVPFFMAASGQIYVTVPNLPAGPAVVQLTGPAGEQVPPVVMQVDSAPPVILSASFGGAAVDAAHVPHATDSVVLTVSGLADANGTVPAASTVHIRVAGVDHIASAVQDLGGGVVQVSFTLHSGVPFGPQQPVSVGVGTRYSYGFAMPVR